MSTLSIVCPPDGTASLGSAFSRFLPKASFRSLPNDYQASKLVPALEAILIETLKPQQNRKRGDDLSAVEYLKVEDPANKKKRIKETIDDL